MTDMPQGNGWWQANDGKWYAPQVPAIVEQPLPPGTGVPSAFCSACGAAMLGSAVVCGRCGTTTGRPKDKTVAVLLAVFFGICTWLYTYKRDSKKFWIGAGLGVAGVVLSTIGIGLLILLGVWIWAIVNVARKPDAFYRQFPNGSLQ